MVITMKREDLEFTLQGCKFQVPEKFLAYCEENREKLIRESEIFIKSNEREKEILHELVILSRPGLNQFLDFIRQLPKDLHVSVKKGSLELKRQRDVVLPQIGRKILFQRMDNGEFDLADIASRLDIRAEENFSDFLEEVRSIEIRDQKRNFNKAARHALSRSGSSFAGIGTDASSTVYAATQAALLHTGINAVHGLVNGVGSFISDALWSNTLANEKADSVDTFKAALWRSYLGLQVQLAEFFKEILAEETDAENENLNIPVYGTVVGQDWIERTRRIKNYREAYQAGDITPQHYVGKIFSMMQDDPTNLADYFELHRIAVRQKDEAGRMGIFPLVNALGYEKKFEYILSTLQSSALALPEDTVEQLEKKITELLNVPGEEAATLRENLIMKHHKMKYSFWAVADGYVGEKFSLVNNVLLYQGEPFTGRVCFYIGEDAVYQGEMKNGVFDGVGTFSKNGELVYDGNWKNGHREGYCTVFHTTETIFYRGKNERKCIYEGYFMENKYDLTKPCKITFENGDIFEGQIIKRLSDDGGRYCDSMRGRIIFANGDIYSGEIDNFRPYGEGKFQTVLGESYSGKWEFDGGLKVEGGFFSSKYCRVRPAGYPENETYCFKKQ